MSRHHEMPGAPRLRIGLFGLLGAGNLGNDASTEIIVRYLRAVQPAALLSAMCTGGPRFTERYGIETVPIQWAAARKLPGGAAGTALKVAGRFLDIGRTA